MELLADFADASGQILVHLGGQFQLDDLAGREEAHGLTGIVDLIPVQPLFHHEGVAFIETLFAGDLTDGVDGLQSQQGLVAKNEIAGPKPCFEVVTKLFRINSHQKLA